MTIFTPDKLPSSDQAASSSSKIRDDFIDHRKQCAADKSAAVVRTNGLELKILQLGGDLRELAGSGGKRIDFVVASLSRCIGDGDRKAQALMISYVDHHTNELRLQLFGEISQVSERVDKVQADLKTYVQKSQTGLGRHIDDAKHELQTDIEKVDEHVGEGTQDVKGEMGQVETRLSRRIDETKGDLKGEISGTKQELKEEIQQVETRLGNRIDATKGDLKGEIGQVETRLNRRIDETKGEIGQVETRLNRRIDETKGEIGQAETRLNKRIDDTKGDLKDEIGQAETRLNTRIDETKGEIRQVETRLKKHIDDTKQDIKGDISEVKESMKRLESGIIRPLIRKIWTVLLGALILYILDKVGFYSSFNFAVEIFEKVLSFFS